MIQSTSLTRFRALNSSIAPRSDPSHDIPLGIPNWIVPAGIVNSTSLSFTYLPQSLRVRFSKFQYLRPARIHRFEPETHQVRARPAAPCSPAETRRRPTYRRSSPDSPAKSRPRRSRRRPAVILARAGHDDDQQGPPRTKTKAKAEYRRQSNTSILSPFSSGSSHHTGVVQYVYYSA